MPRKDKRGTGSKALLELQSSDTTYKFATLSTTEPKSNDINTGTILRSEHSSSKAELVHECNNRIIDVCSIKKQLQLHTLCSKCHTPNMSIRDYKNVGVAHLLQLYCTNCEIKDLVHKQKKMKVRVESIPAKKVYKRVYNSTEYDILISPIVRDIKITARRTFMNFAINVQFLLSAFYLGHSGDSLGFIAGSLDLPDAQLMRQNYYRHSEELSVVIIDTATELMVSSMEQEIIAQYSLDLGYELKYDDVFDKNRDIHDHLPRVGIKIGYDMGWQKRSGGTKYDSLSGHGFYVGLLNNNIVRYIVLSKHCWYCLYQKMMGKIPKKHNCSMNYEGKSSQGYGG